MIFVEAYSSFVSMPQARFLVILVDRLGFVFERTETRFLFKTGFLASSWGLLN